MASRLCLAVACCLVVGAVPAAADERGDRPDRFDVALDRNLARATSPVAPITWATWAYRNGAEFDLALSLLDADGEWSDPVLIGVDDGRDQVDPALTVDARGTFYLAFAERPSGRILLSRLAAGSTTWSEPQALDAGTAPTLSVVRDRLVVAYRTDERTRVVDLPLFERIQRGRSIYDGPDPVESGDDEQEDRNSEEDDSGVFPIDGSNYPPRPVDGPPEHDRNKKRP